MGSVSATMTPDDDAGLPIFALQTQHHLFNGGFRLPQGSSVDGLVRFYYCHKTKFHWTLLEGLNFFQLCHCFVIALR